MSVLKFLQKGSILICCSFFLSCDNELNVNAPYKEVTILYGLLNTADSVQYIKINKAFLGEGDAFIYAANPDSQYHPYPLEVKLIGKKDKNTIEILCELVEVDREEGVFAAEQRLYATPKQKLDSSFVYTIEVKNKLTDTLVCSSKTAVIGDFKLIFPPFQVSYYKDGKYPPQRITWRSAANAVRYDFDIIFDYLERDKITKASTRKSVVINLISGFTASGFSGAELAFGFSPQVFYNGLAAQLAENPNVERVAYNEFKYRFSAAASDLDEYLRLNGNLLTLSDVKPEYSNIENGLGLFSSRFNKTFPAILNEASLNELIKGPLTKDLGFIAE